MSDVGAMMLVSAGTSSGIGSHVMVQLDDGMIAALRQVAKGPTQALRPAGRLPPRPYRRYAPATPRQLAESERQLGSRLPVVVRQLYTLVANGGFGPGDGLLGLVGGAVDHWTRPRWTAT
jgi:hypothetical protein